jgi:hypothetical protein
VSQGSQGEDGRRFVPGGVEEFFPYDGPHSPERVVNAAHGVAALVRYLNNATGYPDTLGWAATVHEVLGGIAAEVHGLDQLFRQLAAAMERQADDPTLYDDRRRDDLPAGPMARTAAEQIDLAREVAQVLAAKLDAARLLTVHLGNDERGEPS